MAETEVAETTAPTEAVANPTQHPIQYPDAPYNTETLDKINAFYKQRSKNPLSFTYTGAGDLEIKEGAKIGRRGKVQPAGTIQLKRFLPLEPSERAALEEARLETLADLEGAYEAELEILRNAWNEYAQTGSMRSVLAANQRVAELDARRNAIRSAVRTIVPVINPVTSQILLSETYEKRKLFADKDAFGKELYRVSYQDFKPEHLYGKYVADEAVAGAEAAAAAEAGAEQPVDMSFRQKLKDGRLARIFYDADSEVNGFLSPMWPVEFTMEETRYFTAIQAYEAERAKELGKPNLREAIMKTRSPRTIRLLVRKETGHPADARGLWLKIFTAIYQQHPPLKEKLLATGTDSFVYADVVQGPSGIGLSEKDSGALDPAKWKGENIVGLTLETVRTQLRETTLTEAPEEDATGGVITEEEQAKAKVGAIINVRRNAGRG